MEDDDLQSSETKDEDSKDEPIDKGNGDDTEDSKNDPESTETEMSYCDIRPIIESKCLRCHGESPQWGAPFSLTDFDSFHQRWGESIVYEKVGEAVERGFMPATWLKSADPPVEPLSEGDTKLLLEWVSLHAPGSSSATCSD